MNLYLLSDNYPNGKGEFFIDNELKLISSYFSKVYVFVPEQKAYDLDRYIPENLEVIEYQLNYTRLAAVTCLPYFLSSFFLKEFLFTVKRLGIIQGINIVKIMIADLVRAKKLAAIVLRSLQIHSNGNSLIYSYWNDYKALSIALLKQRHPQLKCISRAHGWDIFAERQTIPYLPFKKFICEKLDQTYSVSIKGMDELQQLYGVPAGKVSVSRLGTQKQDVLNMKKASDSFIICSCSNLIPLKRVHLIIEILSLLKTKDVHWIHLGDGQLREELVILAKAKLRKDSFTFFGAIPNGKVIEYYIHNFVDLFINVSSSEGIPVSIMEAMSCGIPVMATNVGGNPEIVNNQNGFLIDKNCSCEAMATLIDSYFSRSEKHREQKREAAYAYWNEHYNAHKNYPSFVEEIIGQ